MWQCSASRYPRIILLALACLTTAIVPIRAQVREVRLSRDITLPLLPDSVRMQSAARLGDRMLAVWGTTSGNGGSPRPQLVGQFIVAITPKVGQVSGIWSAMGRPFVVTSTAALPTRAVRVLVLADRFLVVWQDYRAVAGAETWVRTVDSNGITGPEQLLASGSSADLASVAVVPITTGYRVLWKHSGTAAAMVRDADSLGRLRGVARLLTLPGLDLVVQLPGARDVIAAAAGREIMLLDSNSGMVRAPVMSVIPADALVFMSRTGRVITSRRSTTATIYASPYDTVPQRTISAPNIVAETVFSQAGVAMWDTNDHPRISYLATQRIPMGFDDGYYTTFDLVSCTESEPGIFTPYTRSMIFMVLSGNHCVDDHAYVKAITVEQLCATTALIGTTIEYWHHFDCGGVHEESHTISGASRRLTPSSLDAPVGTCTAGTLASMRVERAPRGDSSCISVYASADIVRLAAGVGHIQKNVPERSPGILVRDGRPIVAWLETQPSRGARLSSWQYRLGDSLELIDPGTFADTVVFASRAIAAGVVLTSSGDGFHVMHRALFGIDYQGPAITIITPRDGGWKTAYMLADPRLPSATQVPVLCARPEDGSMVVAQITRATDSSLYEWVRLTKVDSGGAVLWTMQPNVALYQRVDAVIALDAARYILAGDRTMVLLDSLRLIRAMPLYDGGPAHYRLLRGARILRWYNASNADSTFTVELIDTLFNVIARYASSSAAVGAGFTDIVERPEHGGFAVMTARADGLWIQMLDTTLRPIHGAQLISTTARPVSRPAGAFIGDSLAVVWEDGRADSSDIYGAVVPVSMLASAPTWSKDAAADNGMIVVPNPASATATVSLRHPVGEHAIVSIVDALGRAVRRHEVDPGTRRVILSLDGIPAGAYLIVVDDDGSRNSGWCMVVR